MFGPPSAQSGRATPLGSAYASAAPLAHGSESIRAAPGPAGTALALSAEGFLCPTRSGIRIGRQPTLHYPMAHLARKEFHNDLAHLPRSGTHSAHLRRGAAAGPMPTITMAPPVKRRTASSSSPMNGGALSAPLDAAQTQLHLAEARFQDGEIIVIGNEQMQIVSGGGTTTLIIQRGACDTSPVTHASGAIVLLGQRLLGPHPGPYRQRRQRRIRLVPPGL